MVPGCRGGSAPFSFRRSRILKIIAQHQGMIDLRVLGGVQQGYVGILRADAQQFLGSSVGIELRDVLGAKFRESGGIVPELAVTGRRTISER